MYLYFQTILQVPRTPPATLGPFALFLGLFSEGCLSPGSRSGQGVQFAESRALARFRYVGAPLGEGGNWGWGRGRCAAGGGLHTAAE